MNEEAVIVDVIDRLERLGIDYMVVGSYASNAYGRPRGSYDADIVVRATEDEAAALAKEFGESYVVDARSLARDLRRGTMFNLIPKNGIFKVDLIPLRDTPFAREEFGADSCGSFRCALDA